MRRWFRLVLLSGYMLGPWAVAGAQTQAKVDTVTRVDTVWEIPADADGFTFCQKSGDSLVVRAVVDIAIVDSPHQLEETVMHERQHIDDITANKKLCGSLTWHQLLTLEVRAYCVSATVPIGYGADPVVVYLGNLELMQGQFRHSRGRGEKEPVSPEEVIAAWYKECGDLLGLGSPDNGQGK